MIRLAAKADAAAIAKIIKDHAQDDYMGYATFDEKYIFDKMKRDVFLVAELKDELRSSVGSTQLVGCVRLSIVDIDLAEIRTLAVEEQYRRKGLASAMMEKSITVLRERGMRKIVARVKAENKIGLDFFKKFGFTQEGYFKEHYRRGIDVVQLAKFL
jgi:ribosomal protein S18 acetylase RimI-like enzyme